MTDLVERARVRNMPYGHLELIDKLADEIARLRESGQSFQHEAGRQYVLRKELEDEIARLKAELGDMQAWEKHLKGHIKELKTSNAELLTALEDVLLCLELNLKAQGHLTTHVTPASSIGQARAVIAKANKNG
jgi:chromosome segregation ATPase